MKYFKDLTTFHIGGPIKHFMELRNDIDIINASRFAIEKNLKIFILGGGSDILVSDNGFDGLVVKYVGDKINLNEDELTSEAGVNWDDLVKFSVEKNLQGIECLSAIPGTVGASPIQNIGAYGQELKDTFLKLRAYDFKEDKFVEFDKKDCDFSYRESIFKKKENWQRYLITSVTLKLDLNKKPSIKYESLENYLKEKDIKDINLQTVRDAVIDIRSQKLEDPKKVGNAGSFFKNPIVSKEKLNELIKNYPDIKTFSFGKDYKVPAGWLIEKAGWKGKECGSVGVSPKNALVVINKSGKGTSRDIQELISSLRKDVFNKFGIYLETEVQFIGFKKKVAILGYGLEGEDAEKYFLEKGCEVSVLDRKSNANYLKDLNKFDVVVRSPGVYRYLPEILEAIEGGVEITSAVKIFFDNCPGKIIGVTGTKGKGTTSTLIYNILKAAGYDVYLAGNIGKPYLELLPKLNKDSFVVLELSSFQLIDLGKSPYIAVVLNITLDHMDWHKDREEYINSKKNIVKYQTGKDFAVINSEYETPKSFSKLTQGRVIFFEKNILESKFKEKLLLKGEHNLENIAAAVSVARILKIDENTILKIVQSFKGLEHRLELVRDVGGVTFYNDSFATGPQPTIAAIRSFSESETLILGGSDKGLDYSELGKVISETQNIETIILIGKIKDVIKKSIRKFGYKGKLIELEGVDMVEIVRRAYKGTPKGGVVILSPAAASFDMFENYKDRGNKFKDAVQHLK